MNVESVLHTPFAFDEHQDDHFVIELTEVEEDEFVVYSL